MGMNERPAVSTLADGGKYWEHTFDRFFLKAYVPANEIDGQFNNYGFRAPLLLVFEEKQQTMEEAIEFAKKSGLAGVAAAVDSSVLFVYPTCEGGWKNATQELYVDVIGEVRMDTTYADGICDSFDIFKRQHLGYFIRGAKFRTDIYSFGESADYVAKNLLKTVQGEFLWGPGEITPAMCSMQNLSVMPVVERNEIGILSVGNSDEINAAFKDCKNVLIKDKADYAADFDSFVYKFKVWCGNMEFEPKFKELNMTEESGIAVVKTSQYNWGQFKGTTEHKIGYFAYYNNDIFDNGPAPLVIGFHGAGDSSMFLTFVSGWWEVCHKYGFLFVSFDNHHNLPAEEVIQVVEQLKKRYNVDEHRIYAVGFSMGCAKTWDMFQEYPEVFAGVAPASALFPVKNNFMGRDLGDKLNTTVPVPIFYSGGCKSHLPELPFQSAQACERIQYAGEVNKLKKKFDMNFEDKEKWEDSIYGVPGDRVEKCYDEARDAWLTINYYDSEDGVCRTAFASIDNQVHEYRHHTADKAWQFISQFTR